MADSRRRLLLDVDTGIDDAVALLYLLATPGVSIEAITCTAGNVGARQVATNNLALLELCGHAGVEVAVGSEVPLTIPLVTTEETHGDQGIGYAVLPPPRGHISGRHAVDVWLEAVRCHPGQVTGLVTGPLTNLALAIRAEPDLPMLLKGLVIMGGAFNYPGNTTPVAEWNIHVDPHAAKEVFAAYEGLPHGKLPVVCALETTERIECTPAHVDAVARAAGAGRELLDPDGPAGARSSSDNAVVACLSDALRFYMEFHRLYDQGYVAHLHDLFAAMVATGEAGFEERLATVDVETESSLTVGQTVADFAGMWKRAPNARIVSGNEPNAVFELMVRRLSHLARIHG
ncbi:nucleoside hydrolase [Arthrobacter cheniae]|uniref:Nucleoside hydrolase n=1 Tax=Arthrobacter cheniae TaxID=1258888 RepID=A0A3A5LYJ4_9MICC|nr:nucleoside hydrolase [Arthrobacter cheniae]RJT77324.1 nucleoside hydrolase [Arthrobacter cheniae]